MNRLLHTILTVMAGIWLGGLLTLFLAVQSLFQTFAEDRQKAGLAASQIFNEFNRLRLIVAAISLLATFGWWLHHRSAAKALLFTLFGIASGIAAYTAAVLTPQIDRLRIQGLTQTADFRRMHGMSMGMYLLEAILVLVVCVILPNTGKPTARLTR